MLYHDPAFTPETDVTESEEQSAPIHQPNKELSNPAWSGLALKESLAHNAEIAMYAHSTPPTARADANSTVDNQQISCSTWVLRLRAG